MTAAPRATIRPHLYYLLFCAQCDSATRVFICQRSPLPSRLPTRRLSAAVVYVAEEILPSVRKQTWASEYKGDFQKSKRCGPLSVLCILMNANWGRSGMLVVGAQRVDLLALWRTIFRLVLWCTCFVTVKRPYMQLQTLIESSIYLENW